MLEIQDRTMLPQSPHFHDGDLFVSLVDVLRWRAEHQSDTVAFRFLRDGEEETCVLTYAQLNAQVQELAARLQAEGLTGERVLLLDRMGPSCIVAILACMYAGVVSIPLNLPRPNRGAAHVESVTLNAQPRAALSTSDLLDASGSSLPELLDELRLPAIAIDRPADSDLTWAPVETNDNTLAYLQFTSGSTSHPKGVMITHGNVAHNARCLADVADECGPHVGVGWLPHFHDMGLVGTIFLPIWMGFPVVLMPPEAFVMKPIRWLQAISRYGGTISPAPNFAYDHCVRRVKADQRAKLDLSSWRIAFNGAERIDPGALDRFTETFESCGFRPETFLPCYGLAESTLFVTGGDPQAPPIVRPFRRSSLTQGEAVLEEGGVSLVSCGRPRGDLDVQILDKETHRPCPPGQIGEVCISGKSVAAGYWNDPQSTAATFQLFPPDSIAGPFLRTGDLGVLVDGDLFITGREKELIIIGGHNILPEDIEASVETAHSAIHPGGVIAFSTDDGSRERLVVVVEVSRTKVRDVDIETLKREIRAAVARQNDVAIDKIILVKQSALPRTPNGKKRRVACRQLFLSQDIRGRIDDGTTHRPE